MTALLTPDSHWQTSWAFQMEWGENKGYHSSNCLSIHPWVLCLAHTTCLCYGFPVLHVYWSELQNRTEKSCVTRGALNLALPWPQKPHPYSLSKEVPREREAWDRVGISFLGVSESRKAASCLLTVDWGCELGCSTGLEVWVTCPLLC